MLNHELANSNIAKARSLALEVPSIEQNARIADIELESRALAPRWSHLAPGMRGLLQAQIETLMREIISDGAPYAGCASREWYMRRWETWQELAALPAWLELQRELIDLGVWSAEPEMAHPDTMRFDRKEILVVS